VNIDMYIYVNMEIDLYVNTDIDIYVNTDTCMPNLAHLMPSAPPNPAFHI
jgi:hypothetical protein